MSFPKFVAFTAFCLFAGIAALAVIKSKQSEEHVNHSFEIDLQNKVVESAPVEAAPASFEIQTSMDGLPDADRVDQLFRCGDPHLPIVETIIYKSRVPWQKGRPAWITDYASHYKTSRHFIARSLNGKEDYFKQNVGEGDRFNVYREDKNFEFYLLIDLSRCKMWLYYEDLDTHEKELLKTYPVGLGRLDPNKPSGSLTPVGKYLLGDKIVIYKPKMLGFHNNEKIEMVRVFGSRWIPFEKEVEACSAPARGFGIHGVPWIDGELNDLVPDEQSVGKYDSDGCIRLASRDMEELFAIVITKPTTVEIVKDFHDSKFLGVGQ